MNADHVHPKKKGNTKCIYWPISAKSTSFSTEVIRFIYFFYIFFLFSAVRKKAQNGTNGKKDTFFGLIFCFQKTEPVKNYFFAWSKLRAFGVILTMQFEPPKIGVLGRETTRLNLQGLRHEMPVFFFGISFMKEDTSAQLSGRGKLHGGLGL